jgi:hypothetical protein
VVVIKMAVNDKRHPEVKLDQTQADVIQAKLEAPVHVHPMEKTPLQFLNSKFMQGVLWIAWEGAELIAIDSKDLPKRPRAIVCIPNVSEVNTELARLRAQNRGLQTSDWVIISRKFDERGQTLSLSIDPNSYKTLVQLKFKAFWGLGRISFLTLKDNKKHPEGESTASKPPSQ